MDSRDGQVYFGKTDYVLLGIMLVGSMAIGLFFALRGNRKKTQEEYLLGGRRLTALPVCLSLFATFQSAISLLGIPTEIYIYGTMYAYSILGVAISYLLTLVTIIPLMYPLRITTVYEYLAMRYQSRAVQLFGAALGVFSNLSYMMVALLSPALALETAVGIPLWLSIVLVGAVGTVYTTLGGMKSVIWTDVFQTVVIFAGIITVLIKGTMDVGGLDKVWQIGKDKGRIIFDDVSLDPRVRHTVWNQIFGVAFYWLNTHFGQSSVQRLVSTRTIQDAYKVYIYTLPIAAIFSVILIITGLVILAYFSTIRCDPLAAGYIKNKNQIVPYFVLHSMSFLPGFSGLYIATIFSGALSTLSSGISSLAANTVEDFLPGRLRFMSELWVTTITKILVGFFGITVIGLAYLAKNFQGPIYQITYTAVGSSGGPILGLFLLSGIFPQANYIGAVTGALMSLVLTFWQSVGALKFGHGTKTLPLGPTDFCPAGNDTMLSSTPGYIPGGTEGYGLYTTSWSPATTASTFNISDGGDFMDTPGSQERDISLYDISYVWIPFIGASITVILGLAISLVTNQVLSNLPCTDPKFLFPFCRRIWYSNADMNEFGTEMQPKEDSTKV